MKNNKTLGFGILIIALFFISPFVGPEDVIGLKLYSMYSGVDVGLDNLSSVYLDYFIFSTVLGIIFLIISMQLLGWSWKKLLTKLNLGRFNISVGLSFLVVVLVSYLNITNWTTILIISGIIPLIYYNFYRKDKSESFALFTVPLILILFGLPNLLRFILDRAQIPKFLPELNNSVVSWISSTLGFVQVTNVVLIISVAISFLLVFLYVKLLRDKF